LKGSAFTSEYPSDPPEGIFTHIIPQNGEEFNREFGDSAFG
jgi:hypothetical protein